MFVNYQQVNWSRFEEVKRKKRNETIIDIPPNATQVSIIQILCSSFVSLINMCAFHFRL